MEFSPGVAFVLALALMPVACASNSGGGSNTSGGASSSETGGVGGSSGVAGTTGGGTGTSGAPGTGGAGPGGSSGAASGGAGGATGGSSSGGGAGQAGAGATAGSGGQCATANQRVGWVAPLSQKEAGVSGTATMVNDCTIKLQHFNYDGSGIAVYVYAGKGGDYKDGFAISDNIVGKSFTDATLTFTLPAGKTLSDVDGISVWCADAGVSFGDGLFSAP